MPGPTKLVDAFAHGAGSTYITNPIPETTATPGAASFSAGFPPTTMQAPAAGGVPPFGQDMNGILFMISSVVSFLNQGNTFQFDSVFAASIGGYPAGSIVQSSRSDTPGTGYWLNTVAANSNDPDASTASGWVPLDNYGYTTLPVTTGATILTAQQAARTAIILTGTLTGNVQVVLPSWLDSWLVINTCTVGAFSVTVKTAAGSGVVIPAGGYAAPTGVYGDGTNIYASVSPLTVPIDQNPTPLTLAERTNAGYILATYFNQNSAVESLSIGSVFVENAAHDGFLRKVSLSNFLTQLTGFQGSVAANGYITLPGGLIFQWGTVTQTSGIQAHTFPLAFPNACFVVVPSVVTSTGVEFWSVQSVSKTGWSQYANNSCSMYYMALGN